MNEKRYEKTLCKLLKLTQFIGEFEFLRIFPKMQTSFLLWLHFQAYAEILLFQVKFCCSDFEV